MIRINGLKLPVGHEASDIMDKIANKMCLDKIYPGNSYPDFSFRILRRSIDARRHPDIFFIYTVLLLIDEKDEKKILKYFREHAKNAKISKILDSIITDPIEEYEIPKCGNLPLQKRPVVVGTGPCGMFTALLLARRGFCPIVIERGECVEDRRKSVERFWNGKELKADSNVQFGEGGAGTFSDGKLNTLTKDTNGRNSFVIRTFYEHGACEDILTDAKPHIGTDILADVVRNIREEIISLGGTVMFNTTLTGIFADAGRLTRLEVTDTVTDRKQVIDTDVCVLAIGHSARDTFEMLYDKGIAMQPKNFAAGFRVIHPQELVDMWQYGGSSEELNLPYADYKVANEASNGRRVYSFCMCPGGYVVNASSEPDRICTNGMSEHKRDSGYANSAIIAAVGPDDFCPEGSENIHPLAGMYYQRRIEEEAFKRGGGALPVQSFPAFERGQEETEDASDKDEVTLQAKHCIKGRYAGANLRGIFSEDIDEAIIESMHKFGYTRKDFDEKGLMVGVEMRTSSPVRIMRDDSFESSIKGLYPCGEGAGYAGGIVSAATDGIKCAEKIISKYRPEVGRG